jgi:hypothetical protein
MSGVGNSHLFQAGPFTTKRDAAPAISIAGMRLRATAQPLSQWMLRALRFHCLGRHPWFRFLSGVGGMVDSISTFPAPHTSTSPHKPRLNFVPMVSLSPAGMRLLEMA